jgi:hypothetical protein
MNSSDWNNSSNHASKGWNNFANGVTTDVQSTESRLKDLETKFNSLEKKVETMSHNISRKKYSEITHVNITCNNCQKKNITGIRYLCGNCGNYNICFSCIKYAEEIHPNNHFFIRIPDSILWNQMNGITQPLQQNFNV